MKKTYLIPKMDVVTIERPNICAISETTGADVYEEAKTGDNALGRDFSFGGDEE